MVLKFDTLLPCTEIHNNIKVTFTIVKPQGVLYVRSAINAVENCEILKNGLEKHVKFSVLVATMKSYDIMKVKNTLTYKLDHGLHYLQSYFSYY